MWLRWTRRIKKQRIQTVHPIPTLFPETKVIAKSCMPIIFAYTTNWPVLLYIQKSFITIFELCCLPWRTSNAVTFLQLYLKLQIKEHLFNSKGEGRGRAMFFWFFWGDDVSKFDGKHFLSLIWAEQIFWEPFMP